MLPRYHPNLTSLSQSLRSKRLTLRRRRFLLLVQKRGSRVSLIAVPLRLSPSRGLALCVARLAYSLGHSVEKMGRIQLTLLILSQLAFTCKPLPQTFKHNDSSCHSSIQRFGLPFHRNKNFFYGCFQQAV